MSIATFDELKTTIASWLNRDDLIERIPEFISLCEANMKRSLRVMGGETVSTYTTESGTEIVPLPNDYVGMRSIHVQGDYNPVLRQVNLDQLNDSYQSSISGIPTMYAITSDKFVLAPTPDGEYILELDYYGFTPLSDASPTNWILDGHPDAYLFGSLSEASGYIMDEKKSLMWRQRYEIVTEEINERDKAERYGSDLRVRPYGMSVV